MEEKKSVRKMIKEAYLDLLCKKSYMEISVIELITQAKVSRVSYYRIYGSFEAILNDIANDFYTILDEEILPLFMKSQHDERKKFLKIFFGNFKAGKVGIHNILPENIKLLFSRIEDRMIPQNDLGNLTKREKFLPAVSISILITVTRIWSIGGFKESEDEIVEFTYALLENTLQF
ncbi:MAG: TetR/AcrR family transcriptional regulator [Sphaerochaetaceae bacterium]